MVQKTWNHMRRAGQGVCLGWVSVLSLVLALTLGCSLPPLIREHLVPSVADSDIPRSSATVMIGTVTAHPGPEMAGIPGITADDLRFALTETLKRSALFRQVQESGADYLVTAEILSQQVSPAITTDVVMLVRYTLVDTQTKTTVFHKNLFSQQSAAVGLGRLSYDGPGIVEATMRDNLTQFLKAAAAVVQPH